VEATEKLVFVDPETVRKRERERKKERERERK